MNPASAKSHSGELDPVPRSATILLGPYRLTRVLEVGPLATTYQAEEIDAQRSVTVKIFHEFGRHDWGLLDRLQGPTLRGASSPDLPRFFLPVNACDLGDDGRLFLATETVEGNTLADFAKTAPGLEPGRLLELAIRIGEALEVALNLGLVELPLAPDNVIVEEGDRPRLRRYEFTAVRHLDLADKLREMEIPVAALQYASPEELAGLPPTERSVIYRFGVLIYALLSGVPPFNGTTAAELRQQIRRGPKPLQARQRALPRRLSKLVSRMMLLDPLHRPADVTSILNELWAAQCHQQPAATGGRHDPSSARPAWSVPAASYRRFRWAAAVSAGSVGLAILAWFHVHPGWPRGTSAPPPKPVHVSASAAGSVPTPLASLRSTPSTSTTPDVDSRTMTIDVRAVSPRPSVPRPRPAGPALNEPTEPARLPAEGTMAGTNAPSSAEPAVAPPPAAPAQPRAQNSRSADPGAIIDWLMQAPPRIGD
jgi:serine/threonine protein kinase